MSYRIQGLSPQSFTDLWRLADAELAARNISRMTADSDHGFPCRISLEDAGHGETVLLLPFQHHDVAGPYRASGPIFIRESAGTAAEHIDHVPAAFQRRLISVRAYDVNGWMVQAEVMEGAALDTQIRQFFDQEHTAYLHLHNARPGCFAARVDRY